MNVKLKVLTAGALFFLGGQAVMAQKKKDSVKTRNIEEVVVVAFGKQKKESIVGSVVSVDQSVISNQQATSVLTAIQGSVPGVNLISSGGQPGDTPAIRIRGFSSINAAQDPLIILDGAPFMGNINSISQDQIETMNVLKDASSTALYGSRGANGVIIITTKKGKRNQKPQLSLTALTGVSGMAVDMYPLVGAKEYMELSWEALRNTYKYVNNQSDAVAAQNATNTLISNLGYNPYDVSTPVGVDGKVMQGANLLWDTDWQKEILNNTAFRNEYRLSLQGGSDNTTYFFGTDYLDQDGNVKTSNFKRLSTRINLESKVNDWLTVGFNSAFSTSSQNYPIQSGSTYGSSIQWIYSLANIYPVYMRDGNGNLILDASGNAQYDYGVNGTYTNGTRPIFQNENVPGAFYNNKIKNDRYSVNLTGFFDVKLAKGLNNKTTISHEYYTYDYFTYTNRDFGAASNVGGRVRTDRDFTFSTNINNVSTYKTSFGDHNVSVDGIFEAMKFRYNPLSAQTTGFLPNVFVHNGGTVYESISGYTTDESLVSILGRLSYNYQNKYFLEGSFRRDGSSRFAQDVRWGNFYSVGGAWVVSKEKFLENSSVISNLRFKGSYGELGNNRTFYVGGTKNGEVNYFPYILGYETGWNNLGQTGVLLGSVVDRNITWEKTSSLNAGVDLGLFNNKIQATVEYYEKKSVDLIYAKPLPISTGNSSITTNIGALKNYGWEFTVSSENIKNENFSWNTSLNFSLDKNKITELAGGNFISGTKRYEVGRSLFEFWLQEYAGVDPNDGRMMWYRDVTAADGTVTKETTKTYAEATRYYTGKNSIPDVIGGFNNSFRYKNFDLNVLLNFSFGGYIYDSQYSGLMSLATLGEQITTDIRDRWQQPGDVTDVPLLLASQNDFTSQSTRFLFKNDYIRLKSLNAGYNLPKNASKDIGVSNIRFFLQGDNLLTWQSHKGLDPEQSFAGTTNNRSYNLRTFSFGVKVDF